AGRGRRAGGGGPDCRGRSPGPALRGVPYPARAAGRAAAAGSRGRGRALGGPVQPRSDRLPHRLPALIAQRTYRRDISLRRTAPHSPIATAARRTCPDRLGGADRTAPADPRAGRAARHGDPPPLRPPPPAPQTP